MANRRMLNKEISRSLQVNRLSMGAKLLFTWMIPHADDDGKMKGEPEYIKATVIPMINWNIKKVTSYLEEIKSAGLIFYWEVNNERFIEFPKWKDHQLIRKDRYTPSKLPSFSNNCDNHMTTTGIPKDRQWETQISINEDNKSQDKKNEMNDSSAKGIEKLRKAMQDKGLK